MLACVGQKGLPGFKLEARYANIVQQPNMVYKRTQHVVPICCVRFARAFEAHANGRNIVGQQHATL